MDGPYASRLPHSATVREHLEHLLLVLATRAAQLAEFAREGDVELSAWVRSYGGEMPELWFPADLMRRLGELAVELAIDIVVLPGVDEEPETPLA